MPSLAPQLFCIAALNSDDIVYVYFIFESTFADSTSHGITFNSPNLSYGSNVHHARDRPIRWPAFQPLLFRGRRLSSEASFNPRLVQALAATTVFDPALHTRLSVSSILLHFRFLVSIGHGKFLVGIRPCSCSVHYSDHLAALAPIHIPASLYDCRASSLSIIIRSSGNKHLKSQCIT